MDTNFLYLRSRQIIYEFKHLGVYSIIILGMIVYLIYSSLKIYQDSSTAFLCILFLSLLCFSIQSVRRDKGFIFLHSENYHFSLYTEYFLITFPFIVMCLFTSYWFCFPLLQLFLYSITYNKFTIRQKTLFRNISAIIPVTHFEWISGYRKSFVSLIPLYLLALGFSWLKVLPLLLLWCLTMTAISFYNECESLIVLRETDRSPQHFLNKKLFTHTVYLVILYLPVIIINTIFNTDLLALNIFFILTQPALLFFAICYKYSNYRPNQILYLNNVIVTLVSLSGLIPFLLPVPIIVGVKYYFMAKNNLKQYLND